MTPELRDLIARRNAGYQNFAAIVGVAFLGMLCLFL